MNNFETLPSLQPECEYFYELEPMEIVFRTFYRYYWKKKHHTYYTSKKYVRTKDGLRNSCERHPGLWGLFFLVLPIAIFIIVLIAETNKADGNSSKIGSAIGYAFLSFFITYFVFTCCATRKLRYNNEIDYKRLVNRIVMKKLKNNLTLAENLQKINILIFQYNKRIVYLSNGRRDISLSEDEPLYEELEYQSEIIFKLVQLISLQLIKWKKKSYISLPVRIFTLSIIAQSCLWKDIYPAELQQLNSYCTAVLTSCNNILRYQPNKAEENEQEQQQEEQQHQHQLQYGQHPYQQQKYRQQQYGQKLQYGHQSYQQQQQKKSQNQRGRMQQYRDYGDVEQHM